jgi:dolichyl-phosphate beta-glucosyltransferase
MKETPLVSIIIPAHNEERRLPDTLNKVFDFLSTQAYSAEVLVVENGSSDRTVEIAQEYARRYPTLEVIHESGRGKGRAIKLGMLRGRGKYLFMADADLSMPIVELNHFIPPQLNDFDIAIGSREAPGARRYNEPFYRHWGGRLINAIIRLLALPGLQDTQCGFKCFRAEVAKDLFDLQTLDGFAFDVEVLFLARRRAYRIVEVPLNWYFDPESKVHLVKDTLRMILDIWTIRRKHYML